MSKLFCFLLLAISNMIPAVSNMIYAENGEIAFTLFSKAIENNDNNIVISPYSIRECLGMCYVASQDETRDEMATALHFPKENVTFLHSLWKPKGFISGYALASAPHDVLNPEFENTLKTSFEAAIFKSGNLQAAANSWVKEKTDNKIPQLLDTNDVGSASLILLNAIYFKKNWEKPFEVSETKSEPFHTLSSKTTSVPMMHTYGFYMYCETPHFQAVVLPFEKTENLEQYEALILLPRENGFRLVKRDLDYGYLVKNLKKTRKAYVSLSLPKVEMASKMQCKEILEQMGIRRAFHPGAQFTCLQNSSPWIDKVIHAATLTIDESGAEAAAATAATMMTTCMPPPPKQMCCDRPFFFFIREKESQNIIFMAQVTSPT